MAYVTFAEGVGGAARNPALDLRALPATTVGFTALEWSVIAIAQGDRLHTLRRPSRMVAALGALFGGDRHNPRLADPRLEALRRIAVLGWHHGYAVPAHEVATFVDAGFSNEHYELLMGSIAAGRLKRDRGPRH